MKKAGTIPKSRPFVKAQVHVREQKTPTSQSQVVNDTVTQIRIGIHV